MASLTRDREICDRRDDGDGGRDAFGFAITAIAMIGRRDTHFCY